MNASEKIEVHITDTGYLINPKSKSFSYQIPFGGIVKEALEKYYNQRKEDYIKSLGKSDQLRAALNQINGSSIKKILDQSIRKLPLLMSDREQFINSFSSADTLFPNKIEVLNVWDSATKKIVQVFYITKHDDLLLYDIVKVIEAGIYIRPCDFCGEYFIQKLKQEKYCPAHHQAGQKKTRRMNFEADRCRKLGKKIYDRLKNRYDKQGDVALSIRYQQELYAYRDEWEKLRDQYYAGLISEDQFYSWLDSQDKKTRIYKKSQPEGNEI